MSIRIILADDHPIILKGIRDNLALTTDITVVAEASNGREAIDLVYRLQPDILLLDLEMPEMDGIEVARTLKASGSAVRILIFSAHNDREFILGALHEGAAGYLTKDEPMGQLIQAIRGIADNQQGWYSRNVKEMLMTIYREEKPPVIKLTAREIVVCNLLKDGKTNRQIGHVLQVSEKTVEKYIYGLFRKYDIDSRVQLAVFLMRESMSNSQHTNTYAISNNSVEVS